jgi:hypothetical protein
MNPVEMVLLVIFGIWAGFIVLGVLIAYWTGDDGKENHHK